MYIRALATGLCGFLLLTPVHAQEPPSPCGSPVAVPDKPLLEDYPDYSNFLLQIMKYKQAQRDQAAHRNACPDDYLPQPMANSDPTVIDEPETLSSALARTGKFEQIDYQRNRTWYNRSTSKSFVLPPLGGDALASERIRTLLANAGSDTPLFLPMTIVGMQLDGLNDGGEAQQQEVQFSYELLPKQERQASRAAFIANTQQQFSGVYRSGNLLLYLDNTGEAFLIEGTVEGRLR